jgi:hypothetical protein
VTGERERERRGRERKKNSKKILFKENEEWNRDYCWCVFNKIGS